MKILRFKKLDSTNNYAKKLALNGEKENTVIVADTQTAGRGRLGRTFLSKRGGLYFSVILRPDIKPEDTVFLTVAAAVAAARAIEQVSAQKCDVKWVNDIYINNKKVCGILTEGSFNAQNQLDFAILGVGINVFAPKGGFPADLHLAGCIFNKKLPFLAKSITRKVLNKFLSEFYDIYDNFNDKSFIKEYASRSFLTDKEIIYTKDGLSYRARVIGIDDNANLVVESNGKTERLSHGEIQITGMEQLPI